MALGVGMAIAIAPLTTTVLETVDDCYAGVASGINNAVTREAGLLAIAVLSIFVVHAFNSSLNSYLGALHVTPAVRQMLDAQRNKLAGADVPPEVHGRLRETLGRAIAESFVAGHRLAMLIAAGLALLSTLCSLLLIEGKS